MSEAETLMSKEKIKERLQIYQLLQMGENITHIAQKTGHSRDLIRKVKKQLSNGENIFTFNKHIGAPKKTSDELKAEVIRLKMVGLGLTKTAQIISDDPRFPNVSKTLVSTILHNCEPKRPKTAFLLFLSDEKKNVVKKNPEMKQNEVVSTVASMWKNAPDEVKAKYNKLAEEEKYRYQNKKASKK